MTWACITNTRNQTPYRSQDQMAATSSTSKSPYTPLDTSSKYIRLLYLQPAARWNDKIRCRLQMASLDSSAEYEALSYVWGIDSSCNCEILLDGITVKVRRNLWDALFALRWRRTTARVLWIDALCIDQTSLKERNHQVGMMKLIYEKATRVVAWLHDVSTGADERPLYRTKRRTGTECAIARLAALQRQKTPHYGAWKHSWKSVKIIMDHPYWKRLWIFQEFILAREVTLLSGVSSCDWVIFLGPFLTNDYEYLSSLDGKEAFHLLDSYRSAAFYQARIHHRSRYICNSSSRKHKRFDTPMPPLNLLIQALRTTRSCFAHDPRDKIYGLLGVLHPRIRRFIEVEYSRSVFELYLMMIQFLIEGWDPKDLIVHLSELLQETLSAPAFEKAPRRPFCSKTSDLTTYDHKILSIKGFSVGTVQHVLLEGILSECGAGLPQNAYDLGNSKHTPLQFTSGPCPPLDYAQDAPTTLLVRSEDRSHILQQYIMSARGVVHEGDMIYGFEESHLEAVVAMNEGQKPSFICGVRRLKDVIHESNTEPLPFTQTIMSCADNTSHYPPATLSSKCDINIDIDITIHQLMMFTRYSNDEIDG